MFSIVIAHLVVFCGRLESHCRRVDILMIQEIINYVSNCLQSTLKIVCYPTIVFSYCLM